MDSNRTRTNISQVFPEEFPSNSLCALEGLAFTSFTRSVYRLLAQPGIIDRALRYELKGEARRKLVERIAAAYLAPNSLTVDPHSTCPFRSAWTPRTTTNPKRERPAVRRLTVGRRQ